jgi:cytochrome b6-f complex iron-sulfur subunit
MDRKNFLNQVGMGAAALLAPACIGGLAACGKSNSAPSAPSNVDFTVDVSSGALATNGGFLVMNGIIIARTTSGAFLAVSAACTHEGTNVNYVAGSNKFVCPNHNAQFSSTGVVTQGPATKNLTSYNTSLNGSTLRVYS